MSHICPIPAFLSTLRVMKIPKNLTPRTIRLIILAITVLIAGLVFEEVVDDIFSDPKIGDPEALVFDNAVLKKFREIRTENLNQSMSDITALGSFSVITLMTIVLIIFLVIEKDWRGLSYIVLITSGASLIPVILKSLFLRERPDIAGHLASVKSTSFPSGHSFGATVAYFGLAFLLSREVKVIKIEILYYLLAIIVVGLVGTSRMYLGVHYPTDVVGGVSCGLIWFSLVSMPYVYFSKARDVS